MPLFRCVCLHVCGCESLCLCFPIFLPVFPFWKGINLRLLATGADIGEDLALLAACNHSIISYGTFGMWAAILAGGEVCLLTFLAFLHANLAGGDLVHHGDDQGGRGAEGGQPAQLARAGGTWGSSKAPPILISFVRSLDLLYNTCCLSFPILVCSPAKNLNSHNANMCQNSELFVPNKLVSYPSR